jgi:hypothetical protein
MKKISSGVIFFLLCGNLLGQYANLKFENLSTIDGLSSSTCVEIHPGPWRFLWFGTIDGLNKYDGYEFTVYRSVINDPHSISSNRIYCIEEDNLGRLWIGTGAGRHQPVAFLPQDQFSHGPEPLQFYTHRAAQICRRATGNTAALHQGDQLYGRLQFFGLLQQNLLRTVWQNTTAVYRRAFEGKNGVSRFTESRPPWHGLAPAGPIF